MRLVLVLLLSSLASAQGMGGKSGFGGKAGFGGGLICTTPTGANFTESWGDSITSCWAAGPSTCNHTYTVVAGTAESIITSPAGAPANTACINSLQMALPATTANEIKSAFTSIPAATTFDITVSYYLSSSSLGVSELSDVLCFTATSGACSTGDGVRLEQQWDGANFNLFAEGATQTAGRIISINTWNTVVLHHDATAANCSMTVNGAAAQTFTCPTNALAELSVGDRHSQATHVLTYVIGHLVF